MVVVFLSLVSGVKCVLILLQPFGWLCNAEKRSLKVFFLAEA